MKGGQRPQSLLLPLNFPPPSNRPLSAVFSLQGFLFFFILRGTLAKTTRSGPSPKISFLFLRERRAKNFRLFSLASHKSTKRNWRRCPTTPERPPFCYLLQDFQPPTKIWTWSEKTKKLICKFGRIIFLKTHRKILPSSSLSSTRFIKLTGERSGLKMEFKYLTNSFYSRNNFPSNCLRKIQ